MKRVPRPVVEPEVLRSYRQEHPRNTWQQFCNDTRGNRIVFEALASAQGGLCAWCEQSVVPPPQHLLGVQVEHVIAKHKTAEDGPNLHLEFTNMVASCEGGTNSADPERHLKPFKKTQHCGQCELKDRDGAEYLDPREIPDSHCLWQVEANGEFSADPRACELAGVELALARATVANLGLDRAGLRRSRKKVLREIEALVEQLWEHEPHRVEDVMGSIRDVVQPALLPDQGRLSPFWSTLRSYAGSEIDVFLRERGVISSGAGEDGAQDIPPGAGSQ